jgi:hypothetical protein
MNCSCKWQVQGLLAIVWQELALQTAQVQGLLAIVWQELAVRTLVQGLLTLVWHELALQTVQVQGLLAIATATFQKGVTDQYWGSTGSFYEVETTSVHLSIYLYPSIREYKPFVAFSWNSVPAQDLFTTPSAERVNFVNIGAVTAICYVTAYMKLCPVFLSLLDRRLQYSADVHNIYCYCAFHKTSLRLNPYFAYGRQ